jgi:hypothetical protein
MAGTVCQYMAKDAEALAQIVALAECLGLEYRVSGKVVAVMAKDDAALDLLQRAIPAPSSIVPA